MAITVLEWCLAVAAVLGVGIMAAAVLFMAWIVYQLAISGREPPNAEP